MDDQASIGEETWTGIEGDRKPQGVVLPPTRPAVVLARFTDPAASHMDAISRQSR